MKTKNNDQDESLEAIVLWNAACQLVTALEDMAQKRPELLRPVARQTFYWPGFISRKRAFKTENTKLMDKIELGVGGPYSTKQWQISATSTQFAIRLYLEGQKHAKQLGLPPLTTKKNKQIWFERIWKYAVDDLHIEPEKNPVLAKLGRAAVTRNINASAEDIRAEIKKQVWKAFDGLIVVAKK